VYQRSTDGGITWIDSPDYDYRNISLIWQDPEELGVVYTKCQAADSVVSVIYDKIVQAWEEDMAVSGILAVVSAVALAFLTAGTSLAITAVAAGVGAAVIGAGVATAQAAFTEEVLDQLRCFIFNRMDSDSSIDQAGVDGLYTDMDSFIGVVAPTLKGMIASFGSVGLTNMMRELSGDPDANCDECDDIWCYSFDFTVSDGGFTANDGVYVPGVGWQGEAYGTGGGINNLQRNFDLTNVKAIGVVHSAIGFGGTQKLVQWWASGVDLHDSLGGGAFNGDDITTIIIANAGDGYDVDRVSLYWDGAGSSDVTITRITMNGTGSNPFGADNCEIE
jgi:hypothetical protein